MNILFRINLNKAYKRRINTSATSGRVQQVGGCNITRRKGGKVGDNTPRTLVKSYLLDFIGYYWLVWIGCILFILYMYVFFLLNRVNRSCVIFAVYPLGITVHNYLLPFILFICRLCNYLDICCKLMKHDVYLLRS